MESVKADSGLDLLVKGQFQAAPNGQGVVFVNDITDKGKTLKHVFVAQLKGKDSIRPSVLVANHGYVSEHKDGRQILDLKMVLAMKGYLRVLITPLLTLKAIKPLLASEK